MVATRRNQSEDRFYKILRSAGYVEGQIKEPDKTYKPKNGKQPKLPDFEVCSRYVYEVKNRTPSNLDKILIEDSLKRLSSGEIVTCRIDYPYEWLKKQTNESKKKFKTYKNHKTAIVVDVCDWFHASPEIDLVLMGMETLHIDSTGKLVGRTWKNRLIQPGVSQMDVGAYFFVKNEEVIIYHNKSALAKRQFDEDAIEKFHKIGMRQIFIVMNDEEFSTQYEYC